MTYYVRWRGQVIGPVDFGQLTQMFHRGEISRHHQVSTDQVNWVSARNISELQSAPAPVSVSLSKTSDSQKSVSPAPSTRPPKKQKPKAPAWYYVVADETEIASGKKALRRLLEDGVLEYDDLICEVGRENWIEVREVIPDAPRDRLPQPPRRGVLPPATSRNGTTSNKGMDEVFCSSCGAVIKAQAAICVHCGVERQRQDSLDHHRQPGRLAKSRTSFVVLGLFLGGLGIHNFYAGYTGRGAIQLIATLTLGWTGAPLLVIWLWVLIEIIVVNTDATGEPMI